jgi:uncharacterized membrane protein YkvA (DUF1232 family)
MEKNVVKLGGLRGGRLDSAALTSFGVRGMQILRLKSAEKSARRSSQSTTKKIMALASPGSSTVIAKATARKRACPSKSSGGRGRNNSWENHTRSPVRPNPSLKLSPNGGPRGPGLAVPCTFSPARARASHRRCQLSSNVRPHKSSSPPLFASKFTIRAWDTIEDEMTLLERAKTWARSIKRDVVAVYFAAKDSRTPLLVTVLAAAVAAYALSPIDLIPDFIPVLGYLDDLIIVPIGLMLVIRLLPPEVLASAREQASEYLSKPKNYWAAGFIVIIWLFVAAAGWAWWSGHQ